MKRQIRVLIVDDSAIVRKLLTEALTGPAARGDVLTIRRHLDALKSDPDLQMLYRRLTDRTVRLAQQAGRLTASQVETLRTTLLEAI